MRDVSAERRGRLDEIHNLLRGLGEPLVSERPGPERWTIKEVVGHLIDSAANNHQRFIRLQQGPLDFPGYEQRFWVRANGYQDHDYASLVTLFFHYNQLLLRVIENVPAAALENIWRKPDAEDVTLGFIIEDYFRHLEHHIGRIKERAGR